MLEASKLIEDESGELAKFASERATIAKLDATEWRLNQAIIATAAGGRGDAVDLLIKIATTNAKESARAMAAAQLPNLPVSAKSIEAYKSVFEKLGDEAKLVNGASAKNVVANAAPDFFDATLVPWLVQQTNKAKDEQLKTILVIAAAKLMSAADIASVKAIAEKSGGEFGKKVFDAMSEVVSSCGDKVDCYLAEMQKGSNQAGDKELAAIKSAMMVGVYGSDAINDTLMSKLSNVSSAESRGISSKALLRFNPKGSVALADKIDEVVTKNAKFGDEKAKSGDQGLKDAMYRLRARAN